MSPPGPPLPRPSHEQAPTPPVRPRTIRQRLHASFAGLVFGLDTRLRAHDAVFEYSSDPEVILRIGIANLARGVVLRDGLELGPGAPIIQIHLWSERVPRVSEGGAPIAWGKRMWRGLDQSFERLVRFLDTHPEYDEALAVRADMFFGTPAQSDQLARIAARFDFEPVLVERETPLARLHRFGQNILILLLTLASNPRSVRADILTHTLTPVMVSRAGLERRYRRPLAREGTETRRET